MDDYFKELLFPHDEVREIQSSLIRDIDKAIEEKTGIIAHAPTGLGKTASSLPIALAHAIKKNLTVFFLTSRHTQHAIALQTLKDIKSKYDVEFTAVDLIGKQWMCVVPGVQELYSNEFSEYCRSVREDNKCEFFTNTKKGINPTIAAKKALDAIKQKSIVSSEELIKIAADERLCAYEIAILASKNARVIIADYYYLFHPTIRETFLQKTEKELKDIIIIVDEAHNLPKRATDLLTDKISTFILDAAMKEANKFKSDEIAGYISEIKIVLEQLADDIDIRNPEKLVTKEDFTSRIGEIKDYTELIEQMEDVADEVREKQKRSFIGSVAAFLESWKGEDDAFARVLSIKETKANPSLTLTYKCLDPSLLTKDVIDESYATIMMSGTLTPTSMYKQLLGFDEKTAEKEYPSPFPPENRLNIIIPETTTKFTARNQDQFKRIAEICAEICNDVPGNSALFFPSYYLRDEVERYFQPLCTKTTFSEQSGLTKEGKEEFLQRFDSYKQEGAVLLGVASGSFSQGVDFKGDMLKAVVIIGIPLSQPDLETKELIGYYDDKYKKGMEYAYFFPAMTKCIQSAGRCIRSETDRGVIIFLDERFAWQNYKKMFPKEWDIKITRLYKDRIKEFFKNQ